MSNTQPAAAATTCGSKSATAKPAAAFWVVATDKLTHVDRHESLDDAVKYAKEKAQERQQAHYIFQAIAEVSLIPHVRPLVERQGKKKEGAQ